MTSSKRADIAIRRASDIVVQGTGKKRQVGILSGEDFLPFGEDDIVACAFGVYETEGTETSSDKDTRTVARHGGMCVWDRLNKAGWGHHTESGRPVGVQFMVMLGQPVEGGLSTTEKPKAAKKTTPVSATL